MESVQNYLMSMVMQGLNQTAKPSAGSKPSENKEDSFSALIQKNQADKKPADKKPVEQKPEDTKTDAASGTPGEQKDTETVTPEAQQQMMLAAMAAVVVPAPVIAEVEMPEPEVEAVVAVIPDGELAEQSPLMTQTANAETGDAGVDAEAAEPQMPEAEPAEFHQEMKTAEAPKTDAPKQKSELEDADVSVKTASAMEAPEQPLFQEVKNVPIKVGEAEQPEQTETNPVHAQLSKRMEEALRTGESRLELELEPRSLGRVSIEMTMHQDGTMHVLLRAEKPSTQLLLNNDAEKLQSILGRDTRQEVFVETGNLQEKQQMPQYRQEPQDQGQGRQQREQQHPRHEKEQGEDFLHQLRLGLNPLAAE